MSSPRLAIPESSQQPGQLQAGTERQPQQQITNNVQQQARAVSLMSCGSSEAVR